eukprot:CAMPEP_0172574484 /NCGR_PEP_ID=MMETSP1067-20121228/136725_1 /TAXON_ID=265564 ORGANISM="Thalassiosira punctigera, Strain Tpunct2005C2" /NCGR_SAMPLE_ID=MMETSP1067 /ASSEMBLY_ACC=CAM_ASM_000444 /LENGTH=301 /DNA_ID=CAMNT_0013367113 /DNA_START=1140 /DNA_END=2044 /DNA_ORIENTATION=-
MCQSLRSTEKMERIPFVLRPWVSLYRATPKMYIPGTDVDVAFSLRFAVAFSVLRLAFRHALYHLGWPVGSRDTYYVSACVASFCHSSLILPGLAAVLWSQKYVPSGRLEPSPKWYQDATNALMGFCTGYMIYDSIMGYVVETWHPGIGPVLTSDDWTFLGHHILTTLYMVSARWAKAGHMSAMMLMFVGEFSSPVMNAHLILEKALEQECCGGASWLPALFAHNEQFFSALYLAVPGGGVPVRHRACQLRPAVHEKGEEGRAVVAERVLDAHVLGGPDRIDRVDSRVHRDAETGTDVEWRW